MTYVLGIDTSTTATKAVLVDVAGSVTSVAASTYGFDSPRPLWSEQSADLWWDATAGAVRGVLERSGIEGHDIAAIGLTGQMHGMVLLDEQQQPLRPAILWNDQRTAAECDEIRQRVGPERLIAITGNDALTGFTAPKVLWVRNHEPDVFAAARHLLLPKDYVRLRLTDGFAMDKAGAGGTLLLDHRERDWSDEVLAALGIPQSWLPATHEGPEVTGRITSDVAALTGLAAGTPVVAGGGDQAATAVGTGAIDPGVVTASLGTSGVVFAATTSPDIEEHGRVHAFPHAVPDRWHFMGVMLSAAGSLQWLRDELAPGIAFGELVRAAETVPPGSDGLLFLPYLSGERTPHPDPNARGAFVGLTHRHTLAHLTRAVLEGVAYGLRDGLDLMAAAGLAHPDEVRISGGGAKSQLWRQIVANVLESSVTTIGTTEGAAFGAAVLAAVGAGWFETAHAAAAQWVHITGETAVEPDNEPTYRKGHTLYKELYPALRPSFDALSTGEARPG